MSRDILVVEHLHKTYKNKVTTIDAVNDLSFTLRPGQVLGIIGESGSGKSTLAKMIVGLERITSGSILFDGHDIRELLKRRKSRFRKDCQIIFQNPFESFDPLQTIETALVSVVKIHHRDWSRAQQTEYCLHLLAQYGFDPPGAFLHRYPHELSGGQLQRVAIMRAMISEPRLLIADEAVSMLDVSVRADIIDLFDQIVKTSHTSLIFISHDLLTTAYLSDSICVMYLGRIVEYGSARELTRAPTHPYTRALLSCCGDLSGRINTDYVSAAPISHAPGAHACPYYGKCPAPKDRCAAERPEMAQAGPEHYVRCFL